MAKRVLCVGINDYPGTDMDLAGCVNDAKDWKALLEQRGYTVASLHDAKATKAAILSALRSLMAGSAAGDSLVFTFSGHGSWLPDASRDEPDARDDYQHDTYLTVAPGERQPFSGTRHEGRGAIGHDGMELLLAHRK